MAGTREEKFKELSVKLEQGVQELFTSERYAEYLKIMAQFHNYSFNNTVLIAMQKPDATLVAGYQAWQKKFERHVKKGEKGIQIIAPVPVKYTEVIEKIDPDTGEPMLKPDGQPETEEIINVIPRFRVTTVFDISQTEGKDLPEIGNGDLQEAVDDYELLVETLRRVSPVPIRFEEIEGSSHGYYHNAQKEIVIKNGMSESQTLKTIVHEISHAILHDRDWMEAQGEIKDQMTREVEAESVAFMVCQGLHLDTSDYSFPYIAGWSSGRDMKELRTSMDTIRHTAGELATYIEEELQAVMLEKAEKEQNQGALDLVDLFDVPALITKNRVDVTMLPDGIYRYEIRGADYSPEMPLTVRMHVEDNYAATVLTAFPLDFLEEESLWLGDGLHFTGDKQTILEYLEAAENNDKSIEKDKTNSVIGRYNEELYLSGKTNLYAIYQVSEKSKGRNYRFMSLDFVTSHHMAVEAADYSYVYGGQLSREESLESLFEKFNIDHPPGYTGHSLSVSDVVVLQHDGDTKAYYVDSIGFQELPDFVAQRLHEAGMERKRCFSPVTLDSDAVVVDQHEGYWHPIERREIGEEIFYLMKHNEHGDSVSSVIVNADGELVAQELEHGFDRGALEAVREYFSERGIPWEMKAKDLQEWGITETELHDPPVYPHTLEYAKEHADVDIYMESRKRNIDCKNAVEEAIRAHFDGKYLEENAVDAVLKEFGEERISFVLACTVQKMPLEGRFSRKVKEWAGTINVPADTSKGIDLNLDYMVNSHPAVLDGFISLAREKFAEQNILSVQTASDYLSERPVQTSGQKEPSISFYTAECGEFHVLGEYHEGLSLEEAVDMYNKIPPDRMNGIPAIGFRLEDGSVYDGNFDLFSGGRVLVDEVNQIDHYRESSLVQDALARLEEMADQGLLVGRREENSRSSPQNGKDTAKDEEMMAYRINKNEGMPEKTDLKKSGKKESVLKALREWQSQKTMGMPVEKKEKGHRKGDIDL